LPNGSMDQDETWHAGRSRPWPHCVKWGPSIKGGGVPSPIFGPCLLWPNSWMDQDDTWHEGGPWSTTYCARWGLNSPPPKGTDPRQFSAHFCCGQMAGWIKMPLGTEVGLRPGDSVRWGPSSPSPQKEHSPGSPPECRRACRGVPPPQNCPSHGGSKPHLIRNCFGPPYSASQTASRLVQPFLNRSRQTVPILCNGPPLSPRKIVPSHRGSGLASNTWFLAPTGVHNRNGISVGLAVFAGFTTVTKLHKQTERQTTLLCM